MITQAQRDKVQRLFGPRAFVGETLRGYRIEIKRGESFTCFTSNDLDDAIRKAQAGDADESWLDGCL